MTTIQIQREKKFYSDDGRLVHSTFKPNGLTAEIQPNESIRFYGHFIGLDEDRMEVRSPVETNRTLRVGDEVNVIVGRQGKIVSGTLEKVGEKGAVIKPHLAKSSKRVTLHQLTALNRN
jgi:hypothetical protein